MQISDLKLAETLSMAESEEHWHIVYTRPRSERKLATALTKKDILSFLPMLRVKRQWSDRVKWIEKPAFDSYVFVRIENQGDLLTVLRIAYAVRFVQYSGRPATLSDNDIEIIRISTEQFADSLIIRDATIFEPGQKVRIKLGPFAGKEAIVEKHKGKSVLLVSFPALNKTLQVEIPVENLASATETLI